MAKQLTLFGEELTIDFNLTLREAVFGSLNEWCKPVGKQEEVEDDGDGKKKA